MARRPRPTLAQVDDLLAQVSQAHAERDAAVRWGDAAIAEARDFGRRQIQGRRSLEKYVEALHDFNAGRQRPGGSGVDPDPDRFGGSTGPDPVGIPPGQHIRPGFVVEVFGGTPTPNNPEPKLRWYQRRPR